jgi:hypothetical protein
MAIVCAILAMPLHVSASNVTMVTAAADAQPTIERTLDFSSAPLMGELRIGDQTITLERVANGFVARNLVDSTTVVISDEELGRFKATFVAGEADGQAPKSFVVHREGQFGAQERVAIEIDDGQGDSFSGTVTTQGQSLSISYQPWPYAGYRSVADATFISDEISVIIHLVIGAAVVAAAGCAAHALLTNCAEECSEACLSCNAWMVSSSEGLCGTCSCICQKDQTGFIPYIPDGGTCATY